MIDWLRLFENTAFFIRLIYNTLVAIMYFAIILIVWYMMFGTAVFILETGLPAGQEVMSHIFGFWVLDAFESQYEISLGEFPLDAYAEADSRKQFLFVFFLASTFLI